MLKQFKQKLARWLYPEIFQNADKYRAKYHKIIEQLKEDGSESSHWILRARGFIPVVSDKNVPPDQIYMIQGMSGVKVDVWAGGDL